MDWGRATGGFEIGWAIASGLELTPRDVYLNASRGDRDRPRTVEATRRIKARTQETKIQSEY